MKVDWPCPEKGNIRNTKGSLTMDSTWKKKQRAAKGDKAEVSGEGDERPVMDLGHGTADVSRQAEMKILGEGLMCSRHEEI